MPKNSITYLEKNTQDLVKLSHGSKVHSMKALASLSKYLGKYDQWLDIVKRFQLKWSKPDKSISIFKSIINRENDDNNINSMTKWIKDISTVLPQEYKNVLLLILLQV